MFIKRILMQSADNAGAGGQQPPANTAPASGSQQPPAQGAPPPAIDTKAIAETVRDAVFADLRRAGVLGGKAPKANGDSAPASNGSNAPAATPAVDPVKLRSLDRVVSRLGHATALTERQYARMERAFAEEVPDDVEGWVKEYFHGWGNAPASTATQAGTQQSAPANTAQTTQQRGAPVSDGGSPAAPRVPLEEQNVLTMTPTDRDYLIKTKGVRWYMERLQSQTRGVNVRLK